MVCEDALKKATVTMFDRYKEILQKNPFTSSIDKCDSDSLLKLAEVAIKEIDSLPIDKLNRWLGFTQGVLVANGLVTVDSERDYSRPLFSKAYLNKVDTIDVNQI